MPVADSSRRRHAALPLWPTFTTCWDGIYHHPLWKQLVVSFCGRSLFLQDNNSVLLLEHRDDVDENDLEEPLLPQQQHTASSTTTTTTTCCSRNVSLTLWYTWLVFAARSIWSQSVLATFVYLLQNNNAEAVGFITAVMGLSQLVTSFPAGFLADAHRRDAMLQLASVMGVVAIFVTLGACWKENYLYLVLALAVWGSFWGVANTALVALFADSIPTGQRSKYFTKRSILITMGNTTGPLAALAMFFWLGDHWTIRDCAIVMAMGQALCFPAIVLLCFFSDDDAVAQDDDVENDDDQASCRDRNTDDGGAPDEASCRKVETSVEESGATTLASLQEPEPTFLVEGESDNASTSDSVDYVYGCIPKQRMIPILVASADLIAGLGSGMSIRYFPVFFVDNLKLGPVNVQILYVVTPLMQASLMKAAQLLAKHFGRCRVAVAFKWIGILFMISMIASYLISMPVCATLAIYVVRTAFMNSTSALTRSMLMDNVPKEERGKWSALESVNMFSWSGSAALGGILVKFLGIVPLFGCTAIIQLIATFALIALFPEDKGEEAMANVAARSRDATVTSSLSSSSMSTDSRRSR